GEAALVPGEPERSSLYLAVTRTSDLWSAMPPKENDRLSADQIKAIEGWIRDGAAWPTPDRMAELAKKSDAWSADDGVRVATRGGLADTWTKRKYKPDQLWAYQPIRKPPTGASAVHPIDVLLGVGLKKLGLEPAPLADRRTLLRRLSFDLTGLPPT